jgi:hypothetical protein
MAEDGWGSRDLWNRQNPQDFRSGMVIPPEVLLLLITQRINRMRRN